VRLRIAGLDVLRRYPAGRRAVGRRTQARLAWRIRLRIVRLRADARRCSRTVRRLPAHLRRDRMTAPRTRRRSKLAPDPDVRRTIVAAASEALREQGVRGLSVAAVLDRAELS